MRYLQQAFDLAVEDARTPETWFVSLVERVPFYGGPEEGGWWGADTHVVAFREYRTREEADIAHGAVLQMARDLEEQSRREHGEHCLRSTEWLEARGLEADFLPEPDGPSEFSVVVSQGLPEESRGCRQYS